MRYQVLIVFSIFVASFSQILLKKSASVKNHDIWHEYLNWRVISGYMLLFFSMCLNIFAMSKGVEVQELSILESLSYLFVPILSCLLLKEKISFKKILSILLIILGILIFFFL